MTIQEELLAIKGDKELLTAEEVVAWARAHPQSALYNAPEFYGWDKDRLAEEQLLHAARRLIALHITYESGERRFVSLSVDRTRPGGGYRDIEDVRANKSLYDVMLQDALRDLERMEQRYERLKELTPVWEEVKKIRGRRRRDPPEKRDSA